MRRVPKDKAGKIRFYQMHVRKWAQDPEGIGSTPEMVAELATLTAEANALLAAQYAAEQARQAATLALRSGLERMTSLGSAILAQVGVKAMTDGKGIYALASVKPPGKHSRIAPPGTAHSFRFTLRQIGWLELRWKCKNPRGAQGTQYRMYRRIGGTGPFEYFGVVGKRKYIDKTIPPGSTSVMYQVQAVRSTAAGDVANYTVNFGTAGRRPASIRPARLAA